MVIASWFDLMGKNPERLLEALDVAMRPSVCQLVADCMLVRRKWCHSPLAEHPSAQSPPLSLPSPTYTRQCLSLARFVTVPELSLDIDFKATLSPVQVFWWRSFLAYHKAAGNEEKLENVVPVVSDVSRILQKHVKLAVSEARITMQAT